MKDGPHIAGIAALIGDPARAEVLGALLADRALTATELAAIAGVTKQTISAHLAKLLAAGLVTVEAAGRHRYFRLAGPDIGALLEALMGIAYRTGATRLIPGPREADMRRARVCYDHLAGELAVALFERLLARRAFNRSGGGGGRGELTLSKAGQALFAAAGIDTEPLAAQRRVFCRACLDWSERRHHLAGSLGAALLSRILEAGWAARLPGSRVVRFTPRGESALARLFS